MFLKTKARLLHYLVKKPQQILRQNRILSLGKVNGTEASLLINDLITFREFGGTYLEIGVERGFTFEAVKLSRKIAVDPKMLFNTWIKKHSVKLIEVTSNEYFALIRGGKIKFDLVYLDGLHTFEQTYLDLSNTFSYLSSKSIVILDDTVPSDIFSSNPIQEEAYKSRVEAGYDNDGSWHGDVFKVVCALHYLKLPGLKYRTIVDLQNPKTVIWMSDGFEWPKSLPSLTEIPSDNFKFSEYFLPKLNDNFYPSTKEKLLLEIKA